MEANKPHRDEKYSPEDTTQPGHGELVTDHGEDGQRQHSREDQ